MFEIILARILSWGVFWNHPLRQRFRANLLEGILRTENFIYYSSWKTVPRSEGERLIEHRISLLGIPVFVRRRQRAKYHAALLVDEFFGGWDTAFGGYGFTARKYICRFIPGDEIQIDVLLDARNSTGVQQQRVDQTILYRLPASAQARQRWLDQQAYSLFLSIEMTESSFKILSEYESRTPLLYWIRDPRDLNLYLPRLQTVKRMKEGYDWTYVKKVQVWIQEMMRQRRVAFISQGESLSVIARKMYQIPDTLPIPIMTNPVEVDARYELDNPPKENKIIFLGRLEFQKRVWIVCEIAKAMPQYEFYVLGTTGKGREESANAQSLEPYRHPDGSSKIKNLHFTGHVEGEIKARHLKTAKLLLNTSIWEGIPVSWQEALYYGTLLVSAFDRDNIVGRFGTFVGEVMGDGTDEASLKKFTDAIEYWMTHDRERKDTARKGMEFIRSDYSTPAFINKMRAEILKNIR